MSKHTPGPWKVRQRRTKPPHDYEIEDSCPEGHGLVYVRMHNGEQEANARLIAAAPELFEAARGVDVLYAELHAAMPAIVNRPAGDIVMEAVRKARAAIAKATGGHE